MTPSEAQTKVLSALDAVARHMGRHDYASLLSDLIDNLQARYEAVEVELEAEEHDV